MTNHARVITHKQLRATLRALTQGHHGRVSQMDWQRQSWMVTRVMRRMWETGAVALHEIGAVWGITATAVHYRLQGRIV